MDLLLTIIFILWITFIGIVLTTIVLSAHKLNKQSEREDLEEKFKFEREMERLEDIW